MSPIINKSNHPVTVKKIELNSWSLRQEIEACIEKRLQESAAEEIDIEDIKNFYSNLRKPENLIKLDNEKSGLQEVNNTELEATADEESDKEEETENSDHQEGAEKISDSAKKLTDELIDDSTASKSTENPSEISNFQRVFPAKSKRNRGFLFLADLNMSEVLFFCRDSFTRGQNIIIQLYLTKRIVLSAEVISCFAVNRNSRVISDSKPNYRVQCKLTYLFDNEVSSLRSFLKSIEPEIPVANKKKKKTNTTNDNDDEFDDLGF